MFSVNSSLSALMAYGKKMSVHANNVANAYSEGFKRSRAILKEGGNHDVTVEIDRLDSPEYPVSDTSENQTVHNESNNVDLATEVVETKICQRGYEANLSFIKAEDEMTGTILDLLS